ncbi:unnamed protein product [Mytilus edulis]|uniref:HYR domain-containing protein n=1 Tax=Mytilus edulis TaxID=6550 RepID=A0A8S3RZP1_MYTED|nr:unnamed protein product [Mytilus edulis]
MIKTDEAILGAEKYFQTNSILVQLIVTHAEECPYEDLLTLNNEKGKDYAVVNPELFPGAYNFFPELPTRVDEDPGKQFFVYYVGNDTVCWLNVVVKIVRCKQEVSNISDYEGGANCSNLLWGTSCNAACSDGKVSMGGPAVFTCEMDNYNMTYLQLDNDTVCQGMADQLEKRDKRYKLHTDLTLEEEQNMVERMEAHPILYNKKMTTYKDTGKKERMWVEKAEDLGKSVLMKKKLLAAENCASSATSDDEIDEIQADMPSISQTTGLKSKAHKYKHDTSETEDVLWAGIEDRSNKMMVLQQQVLERLRPVSFDRKRDAFIDWVHSAYALKCPEDISIYTDSSYLAVASITLDEWTFPTSLDSNGKPWKIESQTAEEKKYLIGTYTNIVTATSSTGEISSCKFDFIIKLLGCTVPQVDESTIERAVPNKTYHISIYSYDYEKKVCKQGYGWKQNENNKDFVEVKCVETSPGHPEWKNWNSRNCTKNEIPKICGREVILDGKKTEVVYFSYDFMEWKSLAEQNITSCKFRAVVDVYKPPMYDLEMTFQTDTSTPLTADKCFFEVLLYAGESSLGSPIKKFDCTLNGSVKMRWPTLDFTLVFRVLDSFKSHQHTGLTGNGTILFSMKECSKCALSDITGLDVIQSKIPTFKFNSSFPCRMDGCLEDSLQMFKLKLAPNSRHERNDLAYKTCSANIDVQSSTKKICFYLALLSNTIQCRRESRDNYLKLLIQMDSFFTLVSFKEYFRQGLYIGPSTEEI